MKLFTNTFTQGGQTQLHRLHMLRQVIGTTLSISVGVGLVVFLTMVFWELTFNDLLILLSYEWARLVAEYAQGASLFKNVMFPFPDGKKVVSCLWLAQEPTITHFVSIIWRNIISAFMWGCGVGILTLFGASYYWINRGEKIKQNKVLSGREVVSAKQFAKIMRKEPDGVDYKIAGIPLPKNQEMQHIFILGATGTGKTTCIYEILEQIRARGQKAIIVDATGNMLRKYYREGIDKILNPFDQRSESWNLWAECEHDYHYDMIASAFIPDTGMKEKFWVEAPRSIFVVAAKKLKDRGETSMAAFLDCTIRSDEKNMAAFYKGSIAAPAIESRSRGDVIFTLSTKIKCMEILEETSNPFSIRNWAKQEEGDDWLFLSSPTEMRAALQPLIAVWLSIATNALMSLPEVEMGDKRRLWFVIDELPALQRLPNLHTTLAEVRKFAGCCLIGVQDIPMLEEIYGSNLVKSIINNCNTQVILRLNNGELAAMASRWIGRQEVSVSVENISMGANSHRDGVAINTVSKDRDVLSPSEIMQLKNLEGYLILPGDLPIGKLKLVHKDIKNMAPHFVPKPNNLPVIRKVGEHQTEKMSDNNIEIENQDMGHEIGKNIQVQEI